MGQDISLKSERKTHDLNHDLTLSAHTINCVCHSIRSMFRVHGIYNFAFRVHNSGMQTIFEVQNLRYNLSPPMMSQTLY